MQTWGGCAFPDDVLYDFASDTWIRLQDDGIAQIGMTDVSQSRCGRLVQVGWKPVSKKVEKGRPLSVIESSKWVGPMRSPLTAMVIANNKQAFVDDVAIANRDPYGKGWFYLLQIVNQDELSALANSEDAFLYYHKVIEETGLRCFRCEN